MVCCDRNKCPEPDFFSDEGRAKRRRTLETYRKLAQAQLPLSISAILSGGATIGLSVENPNYPFIGCFPFIIGCLTLAAAICAYKASGENVDDSVSERVRKLLGANYGLMMAINCGLGAVSIGTSGWGIGLCASDNEKCTPNSDVRMAFAIVDVVVGSLILFTVWATIATFWRNFKAFSDKNKGAGGCHMTGRSENYTKN